MVESHREEIAKLEALYASHPGGRAFVHLAEAYRKAGEHVRAREILEEGLGRHTDSASGYVVLGRVLADVGSREEAETAFSRVLMLDGGNLVALRGLADLTRADGRLDEAAAYYRELLARSPTNEEVRNLLDDVETHLATAGAGAAADAAAGADAGAQAEAGGAGSPHAVADTETEPQSEPGAPVTPLAPIAPYSAAPGDAGGAPPREAEHPVIDVADLPGDLASFASLRGQRPEVSAHQDTAADDAAADASELDLQGLEDLGYDGTAFDLSELATLPRGPRDDETQSQWPEPLPLLADEEERAEPQWADEPGVVEPVAAEALTEEEPVQEPTGAEFESEQDRAGEQSGGAFGHDPEQSGAYYAAEVEHEPEQADARSGGELEFEHEPDAGGVDDESADRPASAGAEPDSDSIAPEDAAAPYPETEATAAWQEAEGASYPEIETEAERQEAGAEVPSAVEDEPEVAAWAEHADPALDGADDEAAVEVALAFDGETRNTAEPEPDAAIESGFGLVLGGPATGDLADIDVGMQTETMADLYRAQGFLVRAVEVYRALLRDAPDNELLAAKVRAVEEQLGGGGASLVEEDDAGEVWLRDAGTSWTAEDESPAAEPSPYAWTDSAGDDSIEVAPAIRSYLRGLAEWRGAGAGATASDPTDGGSRPDALMPEEVEAGVDPWLASGDESAETPAAEPEPAAAPEPAAFEATSAAFEASAVGDPASESAPAVAAEPVPDRFEHAADVDPVEAAFEEWYSGGGLGAPERAAESSYASPQPAPSAPPEPAPTEPPQPASTEPMVEPVSGTVGPAQVSDAAAEEQDADAAVPERAADAAEPGRQARPSRAAAAPVDGPEEDDEDLAMFRSWLQSLKK
jgi:tetratricopeptide (TPR) repeat protein